MVDFGQFAWNCPIFFVIMVVLTVKNGLTNGNEKAIICNRIVIYLTCNT